MVDSAYTVGIDYDSYRRDSQYYQISVAPVSHKAKLPFMYVMISLLVATIILCSLVYFSLATIPYFDIKEVSSLSTSLPPSIVKELQSVQGVSTFSFAKKRLEKVLNNNPLISHAQVMKGNNQQLIASVSLAGTEVLWENLNTQEVSALIDGNIIPLQKEDLSFYSKDTVKITSSLPIGKKQLNVIVRLLGNDSSTIQQLESEQVPPLEIYIPHTRNTIRIRESISYARLHYVLQLIRLESSKSQITSITLYNQVCYDVYQNTLIMD